MRKAGKTQQEIAEALGVHCARKNENQMHTITGIMSQKSKAEYLESCRARHPDRNRAGKSAMIGEVSDTLRWDRKHAIKALKRKVSSPTCPVVDKSVVVGIWKRSKQPCGKLPKSTIPLWFENYERRPINSVIAEAMDAAVAAPATDAKRRCRSDLSHEKRIAQTGLGLIPSSTVGAAVVASSLWSLTLTDIHTGWAELAGLWGACCANER
jgi:hypothetical protein